MRKLPRTIFTNSIALLGFTLLLGALFKLSAFAREAFITWRFGLSPVTDAYFALQQLPITVAAYMFGPFTRAFTPAYADSYRDHGRVEWFSGMIFYCILIGLVLTAISLSFAPQLLGAFTRSGSISTLVMLSICYAPIILIGVRAGVWMSYGKNLWSLTLAGFPYLLMTITLVGIYLAGSLGELSLPISMTAGFAGVGVFSLITILCKEKPFHGASNLLRPWKFDAFRKFTRQLTASSIETLGYSASTFIMLYFMARAGTGAISANNCATRIGMLGYSLFALPLMQLMQARLCKSTPEGRQRLVRRYILCLASGAVALGLIEYSLRYQIVTLVYMRGNFSATALHEVVSMLPAWLTYFVVLSLNATISLYMFDRSIGYLFTRNMLGGYLFTNILRLATSPAIDASWIIWCAVIAEGGAFCVNVLTCVQWEPYTPASIAVPQGQEVNTPACVDLTCAP